MRAESDGMIGLTVIGVFVLVYEIGSWFLVGIVGTVLIVAVGITVFFIWATEGTVPAREVEHRALMWWVEGELPELPHASWEYVPRPQRKEYFGHMFIHQDRMHTRVMEHKLKGLTEKERTDLIYGENFTENIPVTPISGAPGALRPLSSGAMPHAEVAGRRGLTEKERTDLIYG